MAYQLDRRRFLASLGALYAAVTLGGCGDGGSDGTSAGPSPTVTLPHPRVRDVLLFHHTQGLTPGVRAFAEALRKQGHTVHTPDLFDGRTFDSVEEGVAYATDVGIEEVVTRGVQVAETLPADLVYVGFSLGVMAAQKLAQTRSGARGALLISACVPVGEYGSTWPEGVPVQVHAMDADPWFVDGGDLDAARELVAQVEEAELVLYPGDQHLFADSSLPSYDAEAAALLLERVLAFLGGR